MILGDNYITYIKKLKKEELINIINDYNSLRKIYGGIKIEIKKDKKDTIIEKIMDNIGDYLKYIIMSLDLEDYNILKHLMTKKVDNDYLLENRNFINYLISKGILIQEQDLVIHKDIKLMINNLLKDKEIITYIKKWDRIYKLVDGVIIAYGVVDRKYFDIIISGIMDKELIIPKIEFYYKKEYKIDSKKIVSTKLSNKKRIDSYLKNKKYKYFPNKDYALMGNSLYHHNIKSYKKFIKMLKSNYVFRNKDIEFVDKFIVIPYLYISLNEEDMAKQNLEETVTKYFEFKGDKLKNKMLSEIMKIRDEFPLWEYRGFSKMEVKNEE